ncbi:MAG: 16S rRNA (cytosine(967)-C(5))-methyltransferase RsmB [Lachnospiraceae bacterium]|nr:16S rRNA (cytosine(967)-C(5))-methyltransferase RsmB [Lachnospiraceae bacterium]
MNARELVLDILLSLEREEEYSHRLIKAVLDKYDYLESREKAFIKRLTEGTLERGLELDYYINAYSSLPVDRMRPLMRCLMRMSVYQLLYMDAVPDSAVCNEACKLAAKRGFGRLKGFVNGVLRTISRNKDRLSLPDEESNPILHDSVKYSMPQWLVELWQREYGREITREILGGLLAIHPISLRFSPDVSGEERESLCGMMREMGMEVEESPYLPYVCLVRHAEGAEALPGFREGKCTVQDISSVLAVEAAGIRETDFVVDVCAAPGGKSILAGQMASKGSVLARDLSPEKIGRIRENADRMKAGNIEVRMFDGTQTDETLLGRADVVLLDVPCSGFGVMGKKRDIKYRIRPENLDSLQALQKRIVKASAGYVKPGGTLVYSTCTIHSGENQAMVRFLTEELGFEPVSLEEVLPEDILAVKRRVAMRMRESGIAPAVPLTDEQEAACIQLLPGFLEADGFFIARFQKKTEMS